MAGAKNYWLRSGLINILQNLLTVGVGFLSFYLLVRVLSKEEYGTWVLYLSVVGILEIARNGLTQNAIIKFLAGAQNEEEQKHIVSTSTLIMLGLTLLISCIFVSIVPFLGKIWQSAWLPEMFCLYLLQFLFSGFLNQFNCIEQAHLSFKGTFVSNTVRQLSFMLYLIYCMLFHEQTQLFHLIYIQIAATLLATCIAWSYSKRYLVYTRKINYEWVKKIWNYGKYAFGISISSMLSSSIDQMMLGSLLSKAASGSYNIAVRISNLVEIPTNAMATIVFPQSSKRAEEEGTAALKYLYEKSVGTILGLLIPPLIIGYLFTPQLVSLIAGSSYTDAAPLLRITLITSLFVPYGRQVGTILSSAGRTRLNFFIVVFTAVANIILNFFFIRHFQVVGAAYATFIANLSGFILAQVILKRDYQISVLNPFIYALAFYKDCYHKVINRFTVGSNVRQ